MTDDGAKEWVTVKVPKADKQQADEYKSQASAHQATEPTYGDCLVSGAERLNDHLDSDTARFGDGGTNPDELAESVVDLLVVELGDGMTLDNDPEALAGDVVRKFDYAELANKVADELEGRMR